jgi:glycerol-3-phosphate acyltransferase PlsY
MNLLSPALWQSHGLILVAALAFGYLMGSVPYGLVLTRLAGLGDIRAIGSGNIGATNVLRTGRKGLAFATFLGDALKGTVAILIAGLVLPEAAAFAGLGAFVGHLFPVWLGFKGGKGVATYIGILLGLAWPAALVFCLIWLAVALTLRISSLAALTAAALVPIAAVAGLIGPTPYAPVFLLLSVLVFVTHRGNIVRLMAGTEPRIGAKGKPGGEANDNVPPAG